MGEITDRELLEMIATQVGKITYDIQDLKSGQKSIELMIENSIKPKIDSLFDGLKQNTDQLERIEKEVSKRQRTLD